MLIALAAEQGQNLSIEEAKKLLFLLKRLSHWNKKINLTSVRSFENMISKHVLDSLAIRPFVVGSKVIDVGTGAGFPGLPLSIVEPNCTFTLLDGHRKKISFVVQMITELKLQNVIGLAERSENYYPDKFADTVISRAVTTISNLVKVAGHLVGHRGRLLVLKGRYPTNELKKECLKENWNITVEKIVVAGLDNHQRHLVIMQRKQELING